MDSWCPLNTLTSHTFPNTLPQSGMVSILAADGAKDNPRPLFPRLLPRCMWDFSMLSLTRPALKTSHFADQARWSDCNEIIQDQLACCQRSLVSKHWSKRYKHTHYNYGHPKINSQFLCGDSVKLMVKKRTALTVKICMDLHSEVNSVSL